MKRVLRFELSGQAISRDPTCDFSGLYRGTVGYLYAHFNFSDDWRGCKKAASFYALGKEYAVPIINGECQIPSEVLCHREWSVRVTGVRNNFKIVSGLEKVVQG